MGTPAATMTRELPSRFRYLPLSTRNVVLLQASVADTKVGEQQRKSVVPRRLQRAFLLKYKYWGCAKAGEGLCSKELAT